MCLCKMHARTGTHRPLPSTLNFCGIEGLISDDTQRCGSAAI